MSPLAIQMLLSRRAQATPPFRALPVWALIAAIFTAACSTLYLRAEIGDRRATEEQKLVAIADLKAQEVERWREELERHAAFVASRARIGELADELLATPSRASRADASSLLEELAGAGRYRAAYLVAEDGRVLAASHDGRASPIVERLAATALRDRRIVVAEPRPAPGEAVVATAIPVNGPDGRPRAAIVAEMAAADAISDRVSRWPVPSATGEVRLVEASRGDLSVPAKTTLDGRSVLAVRRPIRGSAWSVLAAVGTAEVDQPAWSLAGEVAAAAAAGWLAAVAALALVARRRAADLRARDAALESARQLAEHAVLLDATMAHELNGPLACMLSNTRYALEELRQARAEQLGDAAAALEDAVDATLRAAEVVRGIQLFAQSGPRPDTTGEPR